MTVFVETESSALAAINYIKQYALAGVDTEFYGVDLSHDSCVGRSICHVFSIGVPSGPLNALGFNETEDYVFPVTVTGYYKALEMPEIVAWFQNPAVVKPLHNQPVDSHTLANHRVYLKGGVNTLNYARWVYPELARASNKPFALDNLAHWRLGLHKTESYYDLFQIEVRRSFEVEGIKNRCACGELSCRKKKAPHDKKWPEMVKYEQSRLVKEFIPLTDVCPGHPLWDRYLAYAGRDAVLALNLYQVLLRDGAKERPYPWDPKYITKSVS